MGRLRLKRGLRLARQGVRAAGALAVERLRTGVVFNPLGRAARRDPYALYRRLRERDPIHPSGVLPGWAVFRHADCLEVLRDSRFSADDRNFVRYAEQRAVAVEEGLVDPDEPHEPVMLRSDPPRHTRLRGLVSKAFTPRAVEKWRGRIEEIADELLDDLGRRGRFELIRDFAVPFPVSVIAEMLGIPGRDRETFKRWSDDLVGFLDPVASPGPARLRQTVRELEAFLAGIVEERRRRPADDLLSGLVLAEEAGDRLNLRELQASVALLLAAGNETTTNLIGNGLLSLFRNPREWERLRAEPALVESAVEELLRFEPPVQLTARIPTADVDFRGRRFRKGELVVVVLASANRDPEVFDGPERLDLGRADNRHLAFGQGIHFCLGAQLARLEGQIAFAELARRFPDLRPGIELERVRWRRFTFLRGLEALPVVA